VRLVSPYFLSSKNGIQGRIILLGNQLFFPDIPVLQISSKGLLSSFANKSDFSSYYCSSTTCSADICSNSEASMLLDYSSGSSFFCGSSSFFGSSVCGVSVFCVSVCGVSVCGISIFCVSVWGVSVCGVSVCGVSLCIISSVPVSSFCYSSFSGIGNSNGTITISAFSSSCFTICASSLSTGCMNTGVNGSSAISILSILSLSGRVDPRLMTSLRPLWVVRVTRVARIWSSPDCRDGYWSYCNSVPAPPFISYYYYMKTSLAFLSF